MDLTRRNNDKSCLILRQSVPKIQPHMCISLNKANRIRLIVSSTDISEEAELRLTSMLNETIKNYWVALGTITKYTFSVVKMLQQISMFRAPKLWEKY